MKGAFPAILTFSIFDKRQVRNNGGLYLSLCNERGEVATVREDVETNQLREEDDQLKEWIAALQRGREVICVEWW